jgi:cytidine deaminase
MKSVYKLARDLALTNGAKYHVACILYRKRKPIRIGVNSDKTHPRFKRIATDGSEVCTLHAEMSVLKYARKGDRLEVLRFLKCGSMTMACPCEHCRKFIREQNLCDVRYTDWGGTWNKLVWD